ncbi:hypothetical protein A4G19_04350 [Pasteurellaceae bacterium Macca]|nr:hypothetical protein [Pasteurellaceae bacterium Macca]
MNYLQEMFSKAAYAYKFNISEIFNTELFLWINILITIFAALMYIILKETKKNSNEITIETHKEYKNFTKWSVLFSLFWCVFLAVSSGNGLDPNEVTLCYSGLSVYCCVFCLFVFLNSKTLSFYKMLKTKYKIISFFIFLLLAANTVLSLYLAYKGYIKEGEFGLLSWFLYFIGCAWMMLALTINKIFDKLIK